MAGFRLRNEPWISTYLDNPDFINYTDYYVRKATTNRNRVNANESYADESFLSSSDSSSSSASSSDESSSGGELAALMNKTDQEISDLLNMDEYYFERFHLSKTSRQNRASKSNYYSNDTTAKRNAEVARKIYSFIKHYYTNPLSLKELARIQVRKNLLDVDYRMKYKIEEDLKLPRRIKEYLLLNEFNL